MVHREVAERMMARPGDPHTASPAWWFSPCHRPIAFRVPPQVFLPAPRVGSAVVALDRSVVAADADNRCGWPPPDSGSGARCSVSPWPASSKHLG